MAPSRSRSVPTRLQIPIASDLATCTVDCTFTLPPLSADPGRLEARGLREVREGDGSQQPGGDKAVHLLSPYVRLWGEHYFGASGKGARRRYSLASRLAPMLRKRFDVKRIRTRGLRFNDPRSNAITVATGTTIGFYC